ncbi:restriction endonuclease subunit S [Pseudoalteromonas sp. Ps84H-4]|jgi:type I restriction enzyme S subunit|uniref:restriction endonuclease subunit S n=1 Tax=Pseudoalteromonas sp. Ps84H-4 TaxID=2954502 RepID=UPI00209862BE|nr:restriction endonuclease subunit S [Pseudoalteromonas sp. Ps84H-4]MCO7252176.1 restriction endonuclease subunit S [Pseudoalteromonas sp. Ps84H-4]|tara:strand:- start:539 stop:1846 length:1308 start_codon:yes stop_codon:yes gene_type:complete
MSHLSYIEKLLDGVEVVWLPLGEIGQFIRGNGLQKKDFIETGFPAIHYGQIYTKYGLSADETFTYISEELAKKLRKAERNDLLLATTSENDDDVVKPLAWLGNQSAISGDMMLFRHEQNVKYLAHYFLTEAFQAQKRKYITGAKVRRVSSGDLSKIVVPIPCPDNPEKSLAIQAEIVRILDAFSAMTAELTAELNMRKKQYNYYRDQLLSFDLSADHAGEGEVEWKTLGDVTKKWYSGGTPKAGNPEFYEDGDIPWLRTQEVKFADIFDTDVKVTPAALQNSSAKWIPENCVIIAISGATAGRSAINKIPLTTNQHCGCLEIDDKKALYRYVFHWVSFNYENIKALGQGARGDLNSTIIKNFRLPVPYANDPAKSLAEQARIVAILDKFDTLTTSLQKGLPREIELRQKQYEYYRDLLLSFPACPAGGPKSEEVA